MITEINIEKLQKEIENLDSEHWIVLYLKGQDVAAIDEDCYVDIENLDGKVYSLNTETIRVFFDNYEIKGY